MRNSIQGPLLRTGNNSSFKALGETGYPVFKMAFQLREAIYRLDAGRDLARHLAVPQNDQGGDRTDWYSSFSGDVIPWSGATESERASARQQFNDFQMAVQALSEQMFNAEKSGAGGDRRVFAQLLKSVVHFPDNEFLYLVNGVLVITFWGFIHPTGEQHNPMHWLQPSSVPVQTPVPPLAPPMSQPASPAIHITETEKRTRRWNWRWLLWLLVALLLLALLLGLLRGCVPSLSLPGLTGFNGEKNLNQPVSDAGNSKTLEGNIPVIPNVNVPVKTVETNAAMRAPVDGSANANQSPQGAHAPAAGAGTPALEATDTASEGHEPLSNSEAPDTEPAPDMVPPAPTETQNNASQKPAVVPNTVPPVIPVQGKPLTLPANLPNGPAQFLNGQWRVNGGIQDKLTGRPLQLQYNFDKGNGSVSVRQSNGVTCIGAARGSVQQGALNITNPGQMKCSDGSNFIGPQIECKSPASGHADCVGNNDGDKTFPIRMLQPNT
ncbi:SrfA family protein [Rahnella sp. Larv3_ips]|uniref:SrfA family protein n=1 Tax=Rahnella sp. Larv3_ips TaxID=1896943 RepID=UPI000EFC0B9A|nr:SrfA family protein [Rahnella sp. Larv3_ips]